MTMSFTAVSGEFAETLCRALLHSLWQGVIWCCLLRLVLSLVPKTRCDLRYAASLSCLMATLLGVFVTYSVLRLPDRGVTRSSTETTAIVNPAEGSAGASASSSAVASLSSTLPGSTSLHRDSAGSQWRLAINSWISSASPFLLAGWFLGVCVSLGRCLRDRGAASRLRVGSRIDNAAVVELLFQLKERLRIRRPVQLVASLKVVGPCVVGILQPVILIPASLVNELSLEQWRAVLTHELAHVRRWDALIDFGQRIVEALLFFNPAVWWMSRQVRIEREACCDAWGAKLAPSPLSYANVLVDVAERLTATQARPLLAFADETSGSLMDRVLRLVSSPKRGDARGTWLASLPLLVIAAVLIVALQMGTDLAVIATAQYLSDQERVTELTRVAEEIVPEKRGSTEGFTIQGTVVTEDGGPLPKQIWVSSLTKTENSSYGATQNSVKGQKTNQFRVDVRAGTTWLFFGSAEYATAIIGPFGEKQRQDHENVQVILKKGISVPVLVVDDAGQPVSNARISWMASIKAGGVGSVVDATSDQNGEALLSHIDRDLIYSVTVTAPGFQKLTSSNHTFSSADPVQLQIKHARPASGIVLSIDGKPLPDAKIKKLRQRNSNFTDSTGGIDPPIAVTNSDGWFTLDQLLDGSIYDLAVQHPDHGPALLRGVQPGDQNLTVYLPPALNVTGVVRGTPEQLQELNKKYRQWRFDWEGGSNGRRSDLALQEQLKFQVHGEEARFEIPRLAEGHLELTLGELNSEYQLSNASHELVIDLNQVHPPGQPTRREVEIVFVKDGQRVIPDGSLSFSSHSPDRQTQYDHHQCSLRDGKIITSLRVPCRLYLGSNSLIGFSVQDFQFTTEVADEQGVATIEIPVQPAGAVRGVVLERNGQPAVNVGIYVQVLQNLGPGQTRQTGLNAQTNSAGEFFISPIPMGAECGLRVTRDKYVFAGEKFTMQPLTPLVDMPVQLGESVPARVRVVDDVGNPLQGIPIQISCRNSRINTSWNATDTTDANGMVILDAINPVFAEDMFATAECNRRFVPDAAKLRKDGKVVEIRLKPGLVIEGTLLDAQGEPWVGQFIKAQPAKNPHREGRFLEFQAEAPTDAQGKFRFSNLPAEPVDLRPEQFLGTVGKQVYVPASADQVKPIVLRSQ